MYKFKAIHVFKIVYFQKLVLVVLNSNGSLRRTSLNELPA